MRTITRYITVLATLSLPAVQAIESVAATYTAPDSTLQSKMIEVALGEVVPEWSYTGSISTVTSDELSYWKTNSLDEAIVGKLAGYYNNGAVRGLNSPNGSAILVVLDGVPAPTVQLSSLDPKSIESVSILKDAAAKALYGPLGAQGVFLVTTKHGHSGKTKVSINVDFGWETPTTKAEMLGSYDYANLRNQALRNDGLAEKYSQAQLSQYAQGLGIDNDWRQLYMRSSRPVQNYNIEIAGGNDRTQFFVNAGYLYTGSLYKADFKEKYNPESTSKQFNIVSNIQVKMFKFMDMFAGTNIRIGHDNASRTGEASIIKSLYTTPPTIEDGIEDGKVIADENFSNPIYGQINYRGVNQVTTTDVNANFGLNFNLDFITKGLTAKTVVGYNSDYSGIRSGAYNYSRWVRDENGQLVRFGTSNDDPLTWSKSSSMVYFMNFQALIKWERTFNKVHSFDAFVSYLSEDRLGSSTQAAWLLPYNRIQFGGHVKYGYDNRYFAQFDFTDAGNEQMRKGNQFHFSPTGSVAWVISNEPFLLNAEWLSLLKLRASFGALEYDVLQYMPSRYLYASEYREQSGAGPIANIYTNELLGEGVLGNPDIKWEKSYQQDYGFDLSLFDNAFTFNFDYWRTRQSQVILQDQTVPMISGITGDNLPYSNIGKVSNQGIDFQFGYTKQLPYGIGLTVNCDFGWNKNKVLYGADIDYSGLGYAYAYRTTGYSIGQAWGYLVDYSNGNGYYNSQEEIDASGLIYDGTSPRPGDLRYCDLNGDGHIDEADKAPLAGVKSMPSVDYGASVKLTWNNFDLYINVQGESGRNAYYSGIGVWENSNQGVYMQHHLQAWTPERYAAGLEISYPALTSTVSSSLTSNDFFTSKADYLRLKNLTIGYSLPQKWMHKMRMNEIRVYFTGENLLTTTNLKYHGIDPEKTNIASFLYRTYFFGLNVAF